ncbi:putative chromatin regulator PHD family [Helianthus annuus]|uniref:Chromatin regulator PHD family n=1 Tax=Helianthus annuus TaxID=4232 RepID=A0A9K3HKF4_HELAN|nr:E3 ubiquitin-protein ligase RHA1B-like [Helianthus annuus]KAF5780015.1 putative chromatin regulator PHD family [Helianthus annuus]
MAIIFIIGITLFLTLRIKSELLTLLKHSISYLFRYAGVDSDLHDKQLWLVDLPIIRFEDLQSLRQRHVDRMCFICSKDYNGDDVVCLLSRCGDVFHAECVGKLLHGKENSCPYCRTPVFSGLSQVPFSVL